MNVAPADAPIDASMRYRQVMTQSLPNDIATAIPAATLVIFREAAEGPPELLMVERAKTMVFAGGALVFPGGRVDPGDKALAATVAGDPDDIAARIAAVRETIEEAGLPVGLTPLPSPDALVTLRRSLHGCGSLCDALAIAGTTLDLDLLVPFARWRPAHRHTRVFDTRFYLAQLPPGAAAATVDATENVRLSWATAADILAEADAGRATIIYPTRRNLERLARHTSFAEAAADARTHPVRTVIPYIQDRNGVPHLCIPTDLGYPVTSEPVASAVRG